jgi:hypothetical protein
MVYQLDQFNKIKDIILVIAIGKTYDFKMAILEPGFDSRAVASIFSMVNRFYEVIFLREPVGDLSGFIGRTIINDYYLEFISDLLQHLKRFFSDPFNGIFIIIDRKE